MISEGLVSFMAAAVIVIPVILAVTFAVILTIFWRQGRPRTGILYASAATLVMAVLLLPVYFRSKAVLDILANSGSG